MSFRQYGGTNYASRHNIVNATYNKSSNLLVTNNVGQPNSYINFESDISGNILVYGDFDLSGNLNVAGHIDCSGNVNVFGDFDLSGNLNVAGNIDCSSNINVAQDIDCSGNLNVAQDIDCSGNITANYMFLSSGTNYSSDSTAVMPKSYIDLVGTGIKFAGQVLAVSDPSSNGFISPVPISPSTVVLPYYIDGVNIPIGQNVLLNDQTSTVDNGVYILNDNGSGGGIFSRSTSILPTGTDATSAFVSIQQGVNFARTGWLQINNNNDNPVIVGTDPLNFTDYYNLNFKLGQGLYTSNIGIESYLNVDTSLNFLTLIDASNSNPILNIGTENATEIIIGQNNGTTTIGVYGLFDVSGNTSLSTDLQLISTYANIEIPNNLGENALKIYDANTSDNSTTYSTSRSSMIELFRNGVSGYSWPAQAVLSMGNNPGNNQGTALDFNLSFLSSSGSGGNYWDFVKVMSLWSVSTTEGRVGINNPSPNYTLDVDGSANIIGELRVTTDYGTSSNQSLLVQDSVSNNALYILPNIGGGQYNLITQPGDVTLLSLTSGNTGNNLIITTPSSTCVGLRITPTSLMIGAGGTNTTPTSNMLFSDTTASVTGNLSVPFGNTYLSLNLQEIQTYSNIGIPNDLGQNILKLYDSNNAYSLNSKSVMIEMLRSGVSNQNWTAQACISMGNYTINGNGSLIDFDLSYLSSSDASGNYWDFVKVMSLWTISTTEGRVGINNPNPNYTLDVSGNAYCSGTITATSFKSTSDYRLKTNVKQIDEYYSVDYLDPVEYDINGQHDMGFIAHEVQEFFPFLVNGEKDGEEIQSINYNGLISLLVKEVKELKNEVRNLKEQLTKN